MKQIPVYWAPDLSPDWSMNPGVLTAVTDLYPTSRGTLKAWGAGTSLSNTFSTTTYGTPLTGRIFQDYDGWSTAKGYVGTSKRLMQYDPVGVAWVDLSKGATDYTTTTDWSFTDWGSNVIAVSQQNTTQVSVNGATFADLGGSPPKAMTACTQKNFVLLGACNDGTLVGNRVWWSGIGNNATWTPDLGTEAGYYDLRDTPGFVRQLVPMRDFVVAYKRDSIYVGEYVGGAAIWSWRCVNHKVGSGSTHGVVAVGDVHYFLHTDGVYAFDGSSTTNVGKGVSNFIASTFKPFAFDYYAGDYDEREGLITWFIDSGATWTQSFGKVVCYNVKSGRWGYVGTPWSGITVKGLMHGSASGHNNIGVALTSRLAIAMIGFSGTTGDIIYPAQLGTTCSITTGDIGDDSAQALLRSVKPKCISLTSLSTGTDYTRRSLSASLDAGTSLTVNTNELRYDGLKAAAWHRLTLPMTGAEIESLAVDIAPAGQK